MTDSATSRLAAVRRAPILLVLACAPWFVMLGWLAGISWFLTEDAFISFRYVRNLLEGNGLVFNIGERVEGYSNFLWVLELAAIWGGLGIPPEDASPWLSTGFTVATVGAMVWWIARLPNLQHRKLVMWMSLGLVCSSATFAAWTSGGGLETRQFTFFIVLSVVLLTTCQGSRRGLLAASVSLALASLTRPDGPLIAAICFAWYAVQSIVLAKSPRAVHAKGGIRSAVARVDRWGLLCLIIPFTVIVGAHFLFRYAYYGDWLPNTYYAKYTRPWYEMGILYLTVAALDTGLYLLLPLAGGGILDRWRAHRGDLAFVLPLMCILPHASYMVQIGGDHFEYRPLDFYWPLLAVPASAGIVWLGGAIAVRARRFRPFAQGVRARRISTFAWRRAIASSSAWALLLFVPIVIYSNGMQGVLLYRESTTGPPSLPRSSPGFDIESVGWLLAVPGVPVLVRVSKVLHSHLVIRSVALTVTRHDRYATNRRSKYQPFERAWRGALPDDAVMIIGGEGIFSYYLPDLAVIGEFGLTDRTIARNPIKRISDRVLVHERIAPPGYLEERGVNIHIYRPRPSAAEALEQASYTVQVGPDLWMPFDTHDHEWASANFAEYGLLTRRIDLNALVGDSQPIIRSRYDVYHIENALIYVNEQCDSVYDLKAQFFLHVIPVDERDLPPRRAEHGFDNLDFIFQTGEGSAVGGTCVTMRLLPEYEIAAIRTGQYLYDYEFEEGKVWEGEFRFDGQ